MTKYSLLACVVAAGGLLVASCSDDSLVRPSAGHGTLAPNVGLDGSVKAPRDSRAEESRADLPVASELSMRLVRTDGSYSKEWATVSSFDPNEQFEVGYYTLEAWYGDSESEGFDCPYYYGSCPVKIEDGKNTSVALTATLAQALVDVQYTESFKHYMTAYSAAVNGHALAAESTDAVYVKPGTVSVTVDFTKPNGESGSNYEVANFTAAAKTHYHVIVDIAGGAGDASIVVTYDDEFDTQEVIIDISDDVMRAAAPEIIATGFANGEPIEFVAGMSPTTKLQMLIMAPGKLKEITMTTVSASLKAQGWPAEVNLLSATADQKAKLNALGFSCMGVFNNPDRTAQLDFSNVLQHITRVEGVTANDIKIVVKDCNYKLSEPMTLALTCEDLVLEITGGDSYEPGSPLKLEVAYNGADLADNVSFWYKNLRSTWTKVTDVTVSEPRSRATSDYTVTLNGIDSDVEVAEIKATLGEFESNHYSAQTAPFEVTANDFDIYPTKAYVTVIPLAGESRDQATLAAAAEYLLSSDGGETFTAVANAKTGIYNEITGLQAGKTYKVKARIDGLGSKVYTFTTEAAAQLPNPGMEDWTSTSGGSNWKIWWPGASESTCAWGTNNPMTTSEGNDVAYCRISGTISTTGNSGNGALIRTVGWGNGNKGGLFSSSSTIKYMDAGLLHLGASRTARPGGVTSTPGTLSTDDLDCGIAFTSRPTALTFKYKYSAKNSSDKGYVEYWLKDAAGNVLASGSKDLEATGEYTDVRLDMTYGGQGTAKGAKIYVKFLSTNSESFLEKNTNNVNYLGTTASATSTFMGSQLSIDDITLIY